MQISVLVPLFNEVESISKLEVWIRKVMNENNFSYEILFVDDGSNDGSWREVLKIAENNEFVKGIRFRRNYGKSAALNTGFKKVQGDVVITMDADLQDSPDEIPELYKMIVEDKFDLVSGWKKDRKDSFIKNNTSKIYNWAGRKITNTHLHDMNCGLKAYRNEVVKAIEVYGEMHRYIPVIAKWSGFTNIGEKVVKHRAREFGETKFGLERFVNGFLDLLTITFVGKFGKRPMHFLGTLGFFFMAIGTILLIYMSIAKLFWLQYGMTERPLFFFAIVSLIVGTQLFFTGFLAELVARNSPNRNEYVVSERLGITDEEGNETEVLEQLRMKN